MLIILKFTVARVTEDAGSAHFRREKFEPKGGPDGGDGGRGGHIILSGNDQMWTLLHLKISAPYFRREWWSGGRQQTQQELMVRMLIVQVPLGTIAKNSETGEVLFEITRHMVRRRFLPGEEEEARVMSISNHQPTRLQGMPSPENQVLRRSSFLNLKYLLMLDWLDSRMPANQHFCRLFQQQNQKLLIMHLPHWSLTLELSATGMINHL